MPKPLCLFVVALLVASCSETVRQSPSDLVKYPAMHPFFKTCGEFKDGTLDLDLGIMHLSLRPTSSRQEMFGQLDNVAKSDGWRTHQATDKTRIYKKNLKRYEAQNYEDTVTISLHEKSGLVNLTWQ